MDVQLHVGAHRTATASLQSWLRENAEALRASGQVFWTARQATRDALYGLSGPDPKRVKRVHGRVALRLAKLHEDGATSLFVSDPDLLGTLRENLRTGTLYPAAGERMARLLAAFGGQVSKIRITIRSQDQYWASAGNWAVAHGMPMPEPAFWEKAATSNRGWREVITDLACACPDVDIHVLPYEHYAGDLGSWISSSTGWSNPPLGRAARLRASLSKPDLRDVVTERGERAFRTGTGEGRWQPISDTGVAILRERYSDDLHWLSNGADGLATLKENTARRTPNEGFTGPRDTEMTLGGFVDEFEIRKRPVAPTG